MHPKLAKRSKAFDRAEPSSCRTKDATQLSGCDRGESRESEEVEIMVAAFLFCVPSLSWFYLAAGSRGWPQWARHAAIGIQAAPIS